MSALTDPSVEVLPISPPQKKNRWVRVVQRVWGEKRAPTVVEMVLALWPFVRLLMGIFVAVLVAAGFCYFFESRRTLSLDEFNADNVGSIYARRTLHDAQGGVLIEKGAPFSLEIVRSLEKAGYSRVPVVDHSMYSDVGDAVWWGFVTMTTVGYGDRYPRTRTGRAVAVVLMFSGIILISSFTATASSVLVARRIREQQRERPLDWSGHLVFCGWNEIAPRILSALDAQSTSTRQVVLLNARTEEAMELHTRGYEHLEIRFIRGNFIREEDLNRANIRQASVAIIVPDAIEGRQPDEQKTFEATTMIKDIAPQVKVFAHVIDAEKVANLKRAMIDDVVVTNEYVGELMAGFVTKPGMPQAIRALVSLEGETELTVIPIAEAFHGRTIGELAEHLRTQERTILLGIVTEEPGFGLEAAMRGGDEYIIELIREEITKAGIRTQTHGSTTRVTLNPENEHIVQPTEMALVIRNRLSPTV